MLFVLLAEHSAEVCPTANSKTRAALQKGAPQIAHLAERHGVKIVAGPFVSHEHITTLVVETEKAESLNQLISESGLAQWNKVRVVPSQTLEEGMKDFDKLKPIF